MNHAPASPLPPRAWLTVALLWPVALLNYLDRQMLATMKLSMQLDIDALHSAENFGRLMAVFMWVYAVCSPLSGFIADRVNRRWLIVASLGVWSAVTLLMGRAQDFSELYALRAAMGVSEAFYIPAGLALIADFHRGRTRSLAVGVHMSGLYIGQALGGIGGWVAQEISWRAAFFWCGVAGVGYAFLLGALLRERPGEKSAGSAGASTGAASGAAEWRGFALLLVCFLLPCLSGWTMKNWLPTLLQDRFALDQKTSGLWATMSTALAGFGGVLLGGRLADVWSRRSVRGRIFVSATGVFLLVPALTGVGLAPSFAVAIGCAALYGLGFGFFDANNMPIVCQLFPPRLRATGYGLLNFVGIAGGAWLTPLLGRLKDHGVPLAQGFAISAAPALVAAVLLLFLKPRTRDCGAPA